MTHPSTDAAPQRYVLRVNGAREPLASPVTITRAMHLISADYLDVVQLRHMGRPLTVMLVDDQGYRKELPINAEATALYHANCTPGTTHVIVGDVVVCPDADFVDDDAQRGDY